MKKYRKNCLEFYYTEAVLHFFLFHLFHNTLKTYKIKSTLFQKQDSTFMQDKRLLRMLHRHLDILRYVFIIGGWLESCTHRNNLRLKLAKYKYICNLQDTLTKEVTKM